MKSDKEVFKELWSWLAENPNNEKSEWPGFEDPQVRGRYMEESYCPACKCARERQLRLVISGDTEAGNESMCRQCPLMKSAYEKAVEVFRTGKYNRDNMRNMYCLAGLFMNWMGTVISADRVRFAELIRDLEWEE
jgi:hypothetical protein